MKLAIYSKLNRTLWRSWICTDRETFPSHCQFPPELFNFFPNTILTEDALDVRMIVDVVLRERFNFFQNSGLDNTITIEVCNFDLEMLTFGVLLPAHVLPRLDISSSEVPLVP
jgi:hypothetical protein